MYQMFDLVHPKGTLLMELHRHSLLNPDMAINQILDHRHKYLQWSHVNHFRFAVHRWERNGHFSAYIFLCGCLVKCFGVVVVVRFYGYIGAN